MHIYDVVEGASNVVVWVNGVELAGLNLGHVFLRSPRFTGPSTPGGSDPAHARSSRVNAPKYPVVVSPPQKAKVAR